MGMAASTQRIHEIRSIWRGSDVNIGKIIELFSCVMFVFLESMMVARCSKCDFWNLWEIWDRNRWSVFVCRKIFRRKKFENFLPKSIFGIKTSIFCRNCCEFLSKFCRNLSKIVENCRTNFVKFRKKQNRKNFDRISKKIRHFSIFRYQVFWALRTTNSCSSSNPFVVLAVT